jgi:uroporphyrinogen decarboxylase
MTPMTSKERVLRALSYKGYDRLPTFYLSTPELDQELKSYLGVHDSDELDAVLGVDMKEVAPRYIGPELRTYEDGSWDGLFGERYANIPYEDGTYPEAVYLPFQGVTSVQELKQFRFPSADWYDYSDLTEQCRALADFAVVYGGAGTMDYMNGIARCRGVEQVLLDVATENPVYLALMERRHEFFYRGAEKALQAAGGLIDILALGEDYGSQRGLLISPRTFDRLFRPYLQQFIDLAHRYGARAMMHSCGSVRGLIPRFVDMGLDILDVVQVDAAGMDIRDLYREFYGKIVFRGSMSVQSTLPFGTQEDVRREVGLRQELFRDGGLIIGPTHQIQPRTPIENILEMYRAVGSLDLRYSPAS